MTTISGSVGLVKEPYCAHREWKHFLLLEVCLISLLSFHLVEMIPIQVCQILNSICKFLAHTLWKCTPRVPSRSEWRLGKLDVWRDPDRWWGSYDILSWASSALRRAQGSDLAVGAAAVMPGAAFPGLQPPMSSLQQESSPVWLCLASDCELQGEDSLFLDLWVCNFCVTLFQELHSWNNNVVRNLRVFDCFSFSVY